MVAGLLAAELLRADYGAFGIAVIFILYFFREKRETAVFCMAAANFAYSMLDLASGYLPLQALAGAAAIPLLLYNGQKGLSIKYAFYAFYPVHIAAIMAIKFFALNIPFGISNIKIF